MPKNNASKRKFSLSIDFAMLYKNEKAHISKSPEFSDSFSDLRIMFALKKLNRCILIFFKLSHTPYVKYIDAFR